MVRKLGCTQCVLTSIATDRLRRRLNKSLAVIIKRLGLLALTLLSVAYVQAARSDSSCDQQAVSAREEKAAQGDPRAQFWLGVQLEQGSCGLRDPQRANSLFQKSAAQDFPPAIHVQGIMLRRDGKDAEALKYFEKSAALGFQHGFADMGFTYGLRESPIRDAVLSYAWLTVAISRESKAPLREYLEGSRNKVARALSEDDLARAKGIAVELSNKFSALPVWSDNQ